MGNYVVSEENEIATIQLTESMSVSTRAKLLMITIPVSREASATNPLGFIPMQGVKLLEYSSRFSTSLPPSKLLTQSGSFVCAILTSSSMAAKASSRYIDLSSDRSIGVEFIVDLVGEMIGSEES